MFIVITALTALILIAAVAHTMWTHSPRVSRARRIRNLTHEYNLLCSYHNREYDKARKAIKAHRGAWYTTEAEACAVILNNVYATDGPETTWRLPSPAANRVWRERNRLRSL